MSVTPDTPGYVPPAVEVVEGDSRPYLERLEEAVITLHEKRGLCQISHFVFYEYESRRRKVITDEKGRRVLSEEFETIVVKPNATVLSMCTAKANLYGATVEDIAREYYGILTASGKRIDAECAKCGSLMNSAEVEGHKAKCGKQQDIEFLGYVTIPEGVTQSAEPIKHQHYQVNSPRNFQTHTLADAELIASLSAVVGVPVEKLDFVYFSVCKGAEPHTDLLDANKFTNDTYVIPVILPAGRSVITLEGSTTEVKVGGIYKFDHTKTHSMELEDNDSGCVVVMVAVLK